MRVNRPKREHTLTHEEFVAARRVAIFAFDSRATRVHDCRNRPIGVHLCASCGAFECAFVFVVGMLYRYAVDAVNPPPALHGARS